MALEYAIDTANGLITVTGTGRVTMPAMIDIIEAVAGDSRFCSDDTVIFDLRQAAYTAELPDGDAFAAEIRKRQAEFRSRFAVVVPPALHVLARLYCVLANAGGFDRMRCFTDLDEARQWAASGREPGT